MVAAGLSIAISTMLETTTPSGSLTHEAAVSVGASARLSHSPFDITRLDALTGLPNRLCFMEELQRAVECHQPARPMLSLLFFDLDGFKFVNDSLGHQAGDELLIQVGKRVNEILDDPNERLFRLAGDEFVILATKVDHLHQLPRLAEQILAIFRDPFHVVHEKAFVAASLGIAVRNGHGQTAGQLLHQADAAMYQAKHNGRNCFSFYSVDLDQEHRRQFQLRAAIREAIDGGEFTVHYQPKFDLRTGCPCGAEALIRWFRHGGLYSTPQELITEAEKCGLIIPLSQQVIRSVAADMLQWQALGRELLPISINISSSHFHFGDLQSDLASAFASQGIAPKMIELELAENAIVQDLKRSSQKIKALQGLGYSVAIDDFGTGRSSIAYLQKLTVDAVKIDLSFIQEVGKSDFASAVVTSMIQVAHTRKLRVIAEGVETPAVCYRLRAAECDEAQGFWFGPAYDADKLYHQSCLRWPDADSHSTLM